MPELLNIADRREMEAGKIYASKIKRIMEVHRFDADIIKATDVLIEAFDDVLAKDDAAKAPKDDGNDTDTDNPQDDAST